jgi:hypothetical protein
MLTRRAHTSVRSGKKNRRIPVRKEGLLGHGPFPVTGPRGSRGPFLFFFLLFYFLISVSGFFHIFFIFGPK